VTAEERNKNCGIFAETVNRNANTKITEQTTAAIRQYGAQQSSVLSYKIEQVNHR